MPLSQIVSDSIQDGAVAPVDLSSVAQYYGFKNRLINGGMGIWQRATSYNMTASWAYGSVDRWISTSSPSTNGVFNRSTSVPTGFQYSVQMGRTAASAATSPIQCTQAIESVNCYDLAGQTVTLSFWAKAGANYSASGNILVSQIGTGTTADQAASNFYSWAGGVYQNQNNTISTTWTRYTHTVNIASNVLEIGVNFFYTPTGTAGADDNVYITGVQLEKGVTATSFDYRPYGTELALCQRYFEKSNNTETVVPTNTSGGYTFFSSAAIVTGAQWGWQIYKVTKRSFATVNVYSYTSSTSNTVSGGSGSDLAANSGVPISQNQVGFWLSNNSGGTITPAVGGFIFQWKADAEL